MDNANSLITEHIDIWTAAIKKRSSQGRGSNKKIELTGIKKLRELILELAVRGKLVPQDPNDEPASVLLEKIAAEKELLIKDKKIKKPKVLPEIGDDEKSFELPDGWVWLRLIESYYSISPSGNKLKGSEIKEEGNYPVVDQGQSFIAGYTELKELLIEIPQPVIVFGDHTTNIKYINFNFVAGADGTKILSPILIYPRYFYTYLLNYDLENRGYARHFKVLNDNLIAIPSLAEQHRIVAKVDELMLLCDQLEQQTEDSITAHQTLVETLLATLTSSENTEALTAKEGGNEGNAGAISFESNWARIAEHFDTLFTTEHSIDQLKQTILQLAVMGKLVPQNPNDEPASVLLEKIAAEKEQLIKDKKIKKQKLLPAITEAEKSFELPMGWKWIRLDSLFNIIVDCPHSTAKFQDSGRLCIDTNSFKQGKLHKHKFRFVSKEVFDKRNVRLVPQSQDIVFAREGSVGESVVIPDNFECCLGQRIMLFRPSKTLNSEFLRLTISCQGALTKLLSMHKGIGAKHVNVKDMRAYPVCLPPTQEQHLIVAKVDELLNLCDQLKARLSESQTIQRHLADAIVEQSVG